MEYKIKIPIGDWSRDGHNACETFVVHTSHNVSEVRQGYKDSCKLTRLQFNNRENYTGDDNFDPRGWGRTDRHICVECDVRTLSEIAESTLKEFGINPPSGNISPINFAKLLLDFIGLSIEDFKYEIQFEDIPYLNGFWNDELNVAFGYGLYEVD